MSTEDRKPQVGDLWRLEATVVAIDDDSDSVTIDFGPDGSFGLLAEELLAYATLIKPAEPPPPLKVGDMVRLPGWTNDDEPRAIAFIGGERNEAVVDLGAAGLSKPYRLSDLRRAETP